MLYTFIAFALFLGIMAAWRPIVVHIVTDYGIIGWAIMMAGIFAIGFWIDRKWPSDPWPGASKTTRRRLEMALNVDIATRIAVLVLLFVGFYAFPRDWMAFWMIPLGLAYWRWAFLQVRHEQRVWDDNRTQDLRLRGKAAE